MPSEIPLCCLGSVIPCAVLALALGGCATTEPKSGADLEAESGNSFRDASAVAANATVERQRDGRLSFVRTPYFILDKSGGNYYDYEIGAAYDRKRQLIYFIAIHTRQIDGHPADWEAAIDAAGETTRFEKTDLYTWPNKVS